MNVGDSRKRQQQQQHQHQRGPNNRRDTSRAKEISTAVQTAATADYLVTAWIPGKSTAAGTTGEADNSRALELV
jgi:hypothetical protein